jgi:hypothetical protein
MEWYKILGFIVAWVVGLYLRGNVLDNQQVSGNFWAY